MVARYFTPGLLLSFITIMYYVYILKGKKYYCGSTNNITRRLQEHKRGSTITTKLLQAHTLVGYFITQSQQEALELEKKIKKSGHIQRWTTYTNFITNI